MWEKCGVKLDCTDLQTLVTVGRYSVEPPHDWYIVLFPKVSKDESPLRYHNAVRAKGPSAVRLLLRGWISQVEH